MAITASYNRPNDYNVVNFQPYELDYDSVLKEAATKQQYWLQGVAKVQEGWKQVSDLDPLHSQNKKELESFNKSAKEEISKLSKTDLSLSENSNKIKDIISPLYDSNNKTGRTILLDSQLNKFYKSEFAKAESYKSSNKGEQYNDTNLTYLNAKYRDYAKDSELEDSNLENKLRKSWDNKEGYTPYYNYNKEIETITKNCKGNNLSYTDHSNPGYLRQVTDSSVTNLKLQGCLYSSLSDKAKNQIHKEGYVNYLTSSGKNIKGLGQDYIINGVKLLEGKASENLKLFNEIEKNKELLKKATSQEDKDFYTSYLSELNQLSKFNEDNIKSITEDIDNISKNPSLLEEEFDRYTSTLHLNKVINGIASSYATINKTTKDIPDTYYMYINKMNYDNNKWNAEQELTDKRAAVEYARKIELEKLKAQLNPSDSKRKKEEEDIEIPIPSDNEKGDMTEKLESYDYNKFREERNIIKDRLSAAEVKYYSILRNSQLNKYIDNPEGKKEFSDKYNNEYTPEKFKELKNLISGEAGTIKAKENLSSYNQIIEDDLLHKDLYEMVEKNLYKKTVKAFESDIDDYGEIRKYNITNSKGEIIGNYTLSDLLNQRNGITFKQGVNLQSTEFSNVPTFFFNGKQITLPKEHIIKFNNVLKENAKLYSQGLKIYKDTDFLLKEGEEIKLANSLLGSLGLTPKDYDLIGKNKNGIKFSFSGDDEKLLSNSNVEKISDNVYLYKNKTSFNLDSELSNDGFNKEKALITLVTENTEENSMKIIGTPYIDSTGVTLYLVYNNKVKPPSWDIYSGEDSEEVLSGNGALVNNFEGPNAGIKANRAFSKLKNSK